MTDHTPDPNVTVLIDANFKRKKPYYCMIPNCGWKGKTWETATEHLKGHGYA